MTFGEKIRAVKARFLRASAVDTLQVNIGYRCNMTCSHCHVSAGPSRAEEMGAGLIRTVLRVVEQGNIGTLDITGGAPELNPHFRFLVERASGSGCHVMVRTNLTVFFERGFEDLPEFLARSAVELIASFPSHRREAVDRIRGKGAFEKGINALIRLNRLGFGVPGGLVLNLVHNPEGPSLPLPQATLESQMKQALMEQFGISFNRLFALTNMPVGRFGRSLEARKPGNHYLEILKDAFNPATIDNIQCRTLVNVGPDGRLYDCDFNQMLGLPILPGFPRHIEEFDREALAGREIAVDDHCFACTAVQGST